MIEALDEGRRLATLADYAVLGAPPLPDLPAAVELAAYVCNAPRAVVNIVAARHQVQLAAYGMDPQVCAREDSMCTVTINQAAPVVLADARADPRFRNNPHVTGVLDSIRMYAASQLRAPDGEVLGTLCVFDNEPNELTARQQAALDRLALLVMDILELHRQGTKLHGALVALERTHRELERSNTALRHFAAQVSHDLKNPLTGVLGFVATLAETPSVAADPDARDCVNRALSSATRMWRMIDDVLAHASAGGRPHAGRVPLGDVAAHVVEDLTAAIRMAGVTVHVSGLPTVVGDATQLRVLLQNLVGNAVKFRHPGRPARVMVSGEEDDAGWTLRVSDNGVGIPPEDRERVLDMFTRLRPEVEGSGIGLATVQRVVEAHRGRLHIDETPGGGTTVVVTLPRVAEPSLLQPA